VDYSSSPILTLCRHIAQLNGELRECVCP